MSAMIKRILTLLFCSLLADPAWGTEISWWNLDGNANDSISTNNGTLQGSPSFVTGKVNQGISLSQASTQYIQVSTTHIVTTDDWSVFAWVKPTSSTTTRYVFSSGDNNTTTAGFSGFYLRLAADHTIRCIAIVGVNDVFSVTTLSAITADGSAWTHVGCVKSGVDFKVYVNKVNTDSSITATPTMDWTGDSGEVNTRIGEYQNSSGQTFDGVIDEVHIYDAAINQGTIDALYDYTAPGAPAAQAMAPIIF